MKYCSNFAQGFEHGSFCVFKILIYTVCEAVGASSVIPSYSKREQILNARMT